MSRRGDEDRSWSFSPSWPVSRSSVALDIVYLTPAVAAAVVVFVAYLFTHPYPALGGGLHLAIAERIASEGYSLPFHIAHYAPGGIPFAYPPLAFYLLAALGDLTGAGPLALARFVPGFVTLLYTVAAYGLGRRVLRSRSQAMLAAIVVASSPAVFAWHLSAGGMVRAPAFLFTIGGYYTGLRLFCGDRRWALPSALLFTLVVLTHPLYPVQFAAGYLFFYLYFDRSARGLLWGAGVALGGLLLSAPWWFVVLSRHGLEVFTTAAGSRFGIGQGLVLLPATFSYLPADRFVALWHAFVVLGLLALIARKRQFLPGWFLATAIAYPKPRFLLLVGAFVVAAFVYDVFLPAIRPHGHGDGRGHDRDRDGRPRSDRPRGDRPFDAIRGRLVPIVVVGLFVLYGTATGALYAANYGPVPDRPPDRLQPEPLPAFIDGADLRAMRWARANTPPGATFLIAGDAAEWFPLFAERTSIASPWGAEWLPPPERERRTALYRRSAACASATCLRGVLDRPSVSPDYLYVPREGSRIWAGRSELSGAQWAELVREFERSPGHEVVYRNRGALIVRPLDRSGTANRSSGRLSRDGTETVPPSYRLLRPAQSRRASPSGSSRPYPVSVSSDLTPDDRRKLDTGDDTRFYRQP